MGRGNVAIELFFNPRGLIFDGTAAIGSLGFTADIRQGNLNLGGVWVGQGQVDGRVYVTGNNVAKVFEVDLESWSVRRTFDTGAGPYNLAVSEDERTLVVTYKGSNAVGFWDLHTGTERARVSTTRTIPHGVMLTPDGAYAVVTIEGIGDEPGTVEVYDIDTATRVAEVDVGKQAGGIAFWKVEGV